MSDTAQVLSLITLAQQYRGDIVRQINRRVILLKLLEIRRGAGKNVAWVAESSGQIAESYLEGADTANFGSDAQDAATLSWGLYRAPIHVSKLAMDAAATSETPAGNTALFARNMVNSASALAALVETDAFSGSSAIVGLNSAIGNNANTYAGIDRTSKTYWQPYVTDPGSLTAPTIKNIRDDLGAIYELCGEVPDIAVCPTAVFNKVASLFDTNRRWTEVNTSRGQVMLDAGYEGIQVDNCMFVKSKDATANQIYYINSNYVHFETLPDARVPQELLDGVQANDGFGGVPLDMSFEKLAKQGPSSRGESLCTVQLVVTKPKSCGVRKNVATT